VSKTFALVGLGVAALGCAEPQIDTEEVPALASASDGDGLGSWVSAERPNFDLGAVMRKAHFAFQARQAEFLGGHATYGVRVEADGRTSIRPYHWAVGETEPIKGGELTLETVRIGREGRQVIADQPHWQIGANGEVSTDRGPAIVESLENTETGLEQSWTIKSEPAGSGDLVVQLDVGGQKFVAATDTGLHFVDPVTGLGFCYGLATLIDAAGTRSTFRPRWRDRSIIITIPAETVGAAAYPVLLDPTAQPEFAIDSSVTGPAPDDQRAPAMAFDGTNWLVVWSDNRRQENLTYDIFGARVSSPSGTVLDSGGILISGNEQQERTPSVAFDGTNFAVIWAAPFGIPPGSDDDVVGQRVSTAGTLASPLRGL
jgi:hypothetical protein